MLAELDKDILERSNDEDSFCVNKDAQDDMNHINT